MHVCVCSCESECKCARACKKQSLERINIPTKVEKALTRVLVNTVGSTTMCVCIRFVFLFLHEREPKARREITTFDRIST